MNKYEIFFFFKVRMENSCKNVADANKQETIWAKK